MTTAAPKRQGEKELTPERIEKLDLYVRAWQAWDSAYDRALESDRKHGRPYDRHRYARVAHEAHGGPMSATWSVTYETATIQAGTAPTKEEAERIAANVHDSYVVKGLNPDALAWHVTGEAAPDGCDSCNGAEAPKALTLRDGSWLCELCLEKRLDNEADTQVDEVARSEALDRERGAGR